MVDNTHGCENVEFGVTHLLIQSRTHMEIVLNFVVSLCLMSCLLRTFVWNRNLSPGPQILLVLLTQSHHQTQEICPALLCKANIQINKIESYLTIS